jgi:adenylate cyclase 10
MEKVKVGQTSLLGYLPAILIKKILEQKQSEKKKPPLNMPIKTVSLFADISGFTKLSESFSKKGRKGSEFLAFCLNRYMELLINIIGKNGGDIIKFAGDALLVIWPQEKGGDEINSCRRAVQCALQIITKLDKLEMIKGRILSVKVGLGFGECKVLLVGGIFDRFECLVVGESMRQACTSECHCKGGGEVVVCESVYKLIQKYYNFQLAPPDLEHGEGDGLKYYTLIIKNKNYDKVKIRADAFLMRQKFTAGEIKTKYNELKKFVPAAIAMYLDIEQEIWSKESRLLTIMFLNLSIDLKHTQTQDGLEHIQNIISIVQRCIYRTQGSLNKFLMDDKGSVLLVAWGLPPLSNHDDSLRAVLTGINLIEELKNYKSEKWGVCGAKIGISTGYCFSGVCGNIGNRREYSVLGEIVNLAARYMQRSMKICEQNKSNFQLLLCEHTKNLIQSQISCRKICSGECKGFSVIFNFYEPVIDNGNIIIPHFSLIKTRRDNPSIDLEGKVDHNSLNSSTFIIGRDEEVNTIVEELDKFVLNIPQEKESKLILISGPLGIGKSLLVRKVLVEFFRKNDSYYNYLPERNKKNYQFLFVTSQLPTTLTHPFNGCSTFLKKIYHIITGKNNLNINIKVNIEDTAILCDEFGEYLLKNNYFRLITFLNEILEVDIFKEHFSIPENKLEYIKTKYVLHFIDENFDLYFSKRNYCGYENELINFFLYLIEEYCNKYIPNITLILIIEDAHLIDSYSTTLINKIRQLPNKFIICTYQNNINPCKPQKSSSLEADKEIKLSGLFNSRDVNNLIIDFLSKSKKIEVRSINKETYFKILSRSFHNNPLFIIELIDSLLEDKQILVNDHQELISSPTFENYCKLMDWSKISIPFIIEKVVGNIIDSLKCDDIITLKHASVIGTIFDLDKLYKLNIINSLTYEGLKQKIYKYAEYGLIEILFDLDPKKIVVKFSIPFLKEILYKRMLVELKNEIHLKVARLMGDSKFRYLPREIEKKLVNHHLIEEEKTIQDHLVDTGDGKVEKILKEVNQRILYLKETIDTVKDIDTRAQDYGNEYIDSQLSLIEKNGEEFDYKNERIKRDRDSQEEEQKMNDDSQKENKIISNRNMPIVKGGSIEKKSDKGITWEKRFVIVTKTRFFYWYTYNDYKSNKQYLGMFELKNIYLIKKLSDYEFGQKTNLLQLKVSSFFKKDQLKDGRDYIFSLKSISELNSWIITLNLLRAKSIYDEFRNTFGVINFPFNHEKVGKEDKRKIKRAFVLPDMSKYKKKKSISFYLLKTKIINKSINNYLNNEKSNEKPGNEAEALIEEQKTAIENECTVKMKERVETLFMVTFGYFLGILQQNISLNISEYNNIFVIGKPDHLIEAIEKSKYYNKMLEEQNKSQFENKKTIRSNISSSNKKVQISGGSIIPGFAPEYSNIIKEENSASSQKFLTNNPNDINEMNNNINNSRNNDKNSENNENKSNDNNNINKQLISQKNESIISSSKKNSIKNSVKDDIISSNANNLRNNSNNNIENQNPSYGLKLSPKNENKTEDKLYESNKKGKKNYNYNSDEELDAKDKLKNLKIEINSKKLEEQIRQLLFNKKF